MMRVTVVLLWVWVAAAFTAYLFQFRPIVGAIGKTMGLW